MALVRSVILVDGENLVLRFQQMYKTGNYAISQQTKYIPDVLLWNDQWFSMWEIDNFRVNYYQSVIGSHELITEVERKISKCYNYQHGNYYKGCNLTPCIFKKDSRTFKSRLVDINITVEAMRMAYSDQVDVVCFISGDGDFIEVYNDLKRRGKQVCVAALSSGLNPRVPISVDRFIDLDSVLFSSGCIISEKRHYIDLYESIPRKTNDP